MAYTILLNKIRVGGKAPTAIYKGGTEVKCVYKGSTLVYDTQKSAVNTNKFTVSYASNYLQREGGSTTPSITKGYSTVATGHSGNTYDKGFTSVSSSVTFSSSSNFSTGCRAWGNGDIAFPTELPWATLNTSTGTLTYLYNRYVETRGATITAKCTINGTQMTSSNFLSQAGAPYTINITATNQSPYTFYLFFAQSPNFYAYSAIDTSLMTMIPNGTSGKSLRFGNGEKPGFYLLQENSSYPYNSLTPGSIYNIYTYQYYQRDSWSSPIIVAKDSLGSWSPTQDYNLNWYYTDISGVV